MEKFEYKSVLMKQKLGESIENANVKIEKRLNELGKQGWELIAPFIVLGASLSSPGLTYVYTFKRRVKN